MADELCCDELCSDELCSDEHYNQAEQELSEYFKMVFLNKKDTIIKDGIVKNVVESESCY